MSGCTHDKRYEHGMINDEDVGEIWCLKCRWDDLSRAGKTLVRRIDTEIAYERVSGVIVMPEVEVSPKQVDIGNMPAAER
jgi:hypothetical protein